MKLLSRFGALPIAVKDSPDRMLGPARAGLRFFLPISK
jgi:hypothetical protein